MRPPWMPADTTPHYFFGVDLGRDRNYTALAVLEKRWNQNDVDGFLRTGSHGDWGYTIRRLDVVALGTPYVDIVDWLKTQMEKLADPRYRRTLVVDATGVGAAVMDLLRRTKIPGSLVGVIITGGSQPGHTYTRDMNAVSRTELLTKLQIAVEEQRFTIAKNCRETKRLISELVELKADGGKSPKGDDLAFATALAVWWGLK
jgi:hypothetical protein